MEIVKQESRPGNTLQRILLIDQPEEQAAVLFRHVKESKAPLATVVVDHENYPTINAIMHQAGKKPVKILLVMLLEDCLKSLNINQPDKEQVMEIAEELIYDFPDFKPEDFRRFFQDVKKGKYGSDYNRFDMSTVYRFIGQYLNERAEIFEMAVTSRKGEMNSEIRTGASDMFKLYDKVVEDAEKEAELRHKKEQLREEAIRMWHHDYEQHFAGQQITEEMHRQYIAKYPLTETYIQFYIKKKLT